jgi:hypothetical protein
MVDKMSEFMGTVCLQTALMGLTLAFKEKYGDETFNVTKAYVERMGGMIGSQMKEKGGITASDAHAIKQVYHA